MHLDLRGGLVVIERVNHLGFAGRQGGVTREDRHAEQAFLAVTERNRSRAVGVRRDIHQDTVCLLYTSLPFAETTDNIKFPNFE